MSDAPAKRDNFSSRLGFIISTIGFSVGVGTLWRFPYVCGVYGGGLYLLTYIFFMVVIGIPLFSAETSIGFASKSTPIKAYQKLSGKKAWGLLGVVNMLCIIVILGYTHVVYAWVLNYGYNTMVGTFAGMGSEQTSAYFDAFTGNFPQVFFWMIVVFTLSILVVRNNLQAGLERVCRILLPALVVIMIGIIIYGLQLPNALQGLVFLFSFNFEDFGIEAILSALSQAFFSLGVAMAVCLVFGSYRKDDGSSIFKNSAIVSIAVIFIAILAGSMVFPMVYSYGFEPAAGPSLAFIVMPAVFGDMPVVGQAVGAFFFLAFFLAAFSSGLSTWECIIAWLMDQFGFSRMRSVWITLAMAVVMGIPCALSMTVFNNFDLVTNNYLLTSGAFFMSIFVGYVWGMDNFLKCAGIKSKVLAAVLTVIIKFVAPVTIIIFTLASFGVL